MITNQKTGWIGVDIGTTNIKVAQIVRSHQAFRLASATIVPRGSEWGDLRLEEVDTVSMLDSLKASQSLNQQLVGRHAAGLLPMALCDVHVLDQRIENEAQADNTIRHAIEVANQRSANQLLYDHWTTDPQRGNWTNVLTVPRNWSEQLSSDVAAAGWSCEAIDGLPHAMARAVGLVHRGDSDAPVAALDWGMSRATLCIMVDGVPEYVRCLKRSGFHGMLTPLIENLQVTSAEAQQLLEQHGLADAGQKPPSETSQLIEELLAEPLAQLAEEIRRSISHFEYQRRSPKPRDLYLFGGGATVNHLPEWLTKVTGIPARQWCLANDRDEPIEESCLFGAAAALSALAWGTQ